MNKKNRFLLLKSISRRRRLLVILTAYDAPTGALLEKLGVDMILVGDSLGTVLLGYDSTLQVSMDEMIHHSKAVRRGAPHTFIIGDLPLKGRMGRLSQSVQSADRFIHEAGCDAVKLEWNHDTRRLTRNLVQRGIPIMGHVGLTPQTAHKQGGLTVQGKTAQSAMQIYQAAKSFEEDGAFSVVLECIPYPLAKIITASLSIPTIGIGAGPHCKGQVLVFHDAVGLIPNFSPRFVKHFTRLYDIEKKAVEKFIHDVRHNRFPSNKHAYSMSPKVFEEFQELRNSIKS